MNRAALLHFPVEEFIYPISSNELIFRLQGEREDFKSCTLVLWRRYGNPKDKRRIQMQCVLRDNDHDYFTAHVILKNTACYIRYYFEVTDGVSTLWYGAQGIQQHEPENYFEYLYPNISDGYASSEWCKKQIYYQIFPERFKNGNIRNDPENTEPWGSLPTRDNNMGGDLKGIIDNLDYISKLGVTCIYLTPIFEGYSNHKYDTINYFKIDPQFGTENDLLCLVEKFHGKGIRVILDGVFNHCGFYFPPFQDLLKNGKKSKYRNWFFCEFPICTDPPNYECVGYYKWMPKLNLGNPEVRNYFIKVGKYWIKNFEIDGWRLDVADEVEGRFWELFSCAVKEDFPDTVLIGESWGNAQRLVLGNRLDGAMNYLFKNAVTDWIAKEKIDVSEFNHRINLMLALYPEEVNLHMYNLLDSHDTPRFLYDCGEDVRKLKLAVALMMTFPGCPAIFYGDEIGLSGANDPDCRRAMNWDKSSQNKELFNWYQKLIEIRKNTSTLIEGGFCTNICNSETNVYGYIRSCGDENIYIVINPSKIEQKIFVPILEENDSIWLELLNGEVIKANKLDVYESYYNYDIAKYRSRLITAMHPYSIKIFKRKWCNYERRKQ